MGNPKRIRKKYITPMHPWQRTRLEEEKILEREYGLKNKKEIWKQASVLKRIIANYKKTGSTEQAKHEKEQVLTKMVGLGIIKKGSSSDEILGLTVKSILERRLQTIVCRKNLARSMKQARQFIVHRHISIGDKVVTSPSYLVTLDDQSKIQFITQSALFDEAHPERSVPEQQELQKIKDATITEAPKEEPKAKEVEAANPVDIKDEEVPVEAEKPKAEKEKAPAKESKSKEESVPAKEAKEEKKDE
jgi:small subunit ribosomal protein S4